MTYERETSAPSTAARRQGWLARIMVSAETLNRIQFHAPWRHPRDCRQG